MANLFLDTHPVQHRLISRFIIQDEHGLSIILKVGLKAVKLVPDSGLQYRPSHAMSSCSCYDP